MKRNFSCMLLILFAVVAAPAQNANDVLYLQDGRERVGELVRVTPDAVVFHAAGEAEATSFPKDQVQRVELSRPRQGDQARTAAELNDPLLARLLEQQPSKFAHPDSGYVTLYQLHDYAVEPDGSFTLVERCVEKILLERGKDRATVARYFKQGEETLDIDFARTINPDGSVTPISDAGVDITSVHSDHPEYERLYQVKFAMKQIKEGSVIDYQVTRRRSTTDLLHPVYIAGLFQDDEPILEAEVRISVPREQTLALRADRLGDNITQAREEVGDRVVYQVVAKDCPRVVPEPMMPPAADLYPCVRAALTTSWEAIGEAYGAALRDSAQPSPEIEAAVAELIAGVNDPAERARRIYHHFLATFRQLWVWPAQYQYAPRPVADVFAQRAGNSIDKAALLMAMFRAADLEAAVVLACPQSSGKLVEDVPCIRQFNDALVAVELPSGRQFCAVYDESVRFGQMPAGYQGTRGLLVTPDASALVDVPLNPPAEEQSASEYRLTLTADGNIAVEKTTVPTGNGEIGIRNAWKDLKDEELRREIEVSLTAAHPEAKLQDYTVENLHDVTKPLRFTMRYTLEDYALRASDELLVFQLPEVKYTAGSVGKDTREFPLRWTLRAESRKDMTIALPPGYKVYYAGKNYEYDCGLASFTATFVAEEGQIRYHDAFVQNALEAPATAYKDYKALIETQARVPKEWIVLERIPG